MIKKQLQNVNLDHNNNERQHIFILNLFQYVLLLNVCSIFITCLLTMFIALLINACLVCYKNVECDE